MQNEENDPLIMYLIVRDSLNMGVGKIAAQCAHAAHKIVEKTLSSYDRVQMEYSAHLTKMGVFNAWSNTNYRKVVLKADEKDWEKLKKEVGNNDIIISDLGLTEIEPNETVIGFFSNV